MFRIILRIVFSEILGFSDYSTFKYLKINEMRDKSGVARHVADKIRLQIENLAKPKETKIERDLINLVLSYNGSPVKIQGVGNKSMPDRLCLFPGGRVWFVETKKPGKKPDNLQLFTHAKLREMGFNVSVIWNREQLKQFENEISGA